MSRRWILIVAVLCPACARGSGPPPDDVTTSDKPAPTTDPSGEPAAPAPTAPSTASSPTHAAAGSPAEPAPASKPPAGGDPSIDCQALWAVADHLGCGVAQLLCVVLESIPSAGAQVPCDVAVPLACGFASSAADAAEALCPR
jgi:hypothetical protein